MTRTRRFATILALSALTGCASQVIVPDSARGPKPEVKALQSYSVEASPQAKKQLGDSVKFDVDALSRTLERTLRAKDLIAPDGDFRLKVVVDDVRVRSTFNAVMWGFMAGDDHVNGNAVLLSATGERPEYAFQVKASYALGGIAGGQDSTRVDWLYEEFSKKIAEQLLALRD